jgi:hypothetical protein
VITARMPLDALPPPSSVVEQAVDERVFDPSIRRDRQDLFGQLLKIDRVMAETGQSVLTSTSNT